MPNELRERDWEDLLSNIQDRLCTPFIGAGACAGTLPCGRDIASRWAGEYGYPLLDSGDLARVAQFVAIDRYEMCPKDVIRRQFRDVRPPDFSALDEPHGVLADLSLPIYITTNYDSFMSQALESRERAPRREFCRWNRFPQVMGQESVFDSGFEPSVATPLVYHLHGHCEIPQSMVLTEADYLDFLIGLSSNQDLLPPAIRTALAGTSLLFVGYSLTDWNFRVLFRGLIGSLGASLGYSSIAVQLPPGDLAGQELERAKRYLDQYFDKIQKIQVRVYWGDVREFARELRERWEDFSDAN
jgi:hypothetical protein